MWALHCCLNRISNNLNQDTSNLFQIMFPDNKIAKSFQMAPNKIEYSITHYIGPYVRGLLVELLNQTPRLILSFEESLNKKQPCQIDLFIRYWNEKKMQVKVEYWDSSLMGHCTVMI